MNAADTPNIVTGHAHALKAANVQALGVYGRLDRCTMEMIQGLHSAGIGVFVAYEKGNPTQASYFTSDQAHYDAEQFLSWAQAVGFPKGLAPFAAIDDDVTPAQTEDYVTTFHGALKDEGYLEGLYGSHLVLQHYLDEGYSHASWLAYAPKWGGSAQEYEAWKPNADIVQGPGATIAGFDCDSDIVQNPGVLWLPEVA